MQVVVIGKTAVGIGVQCDDPKCTWDSVPFMQINYTLGHRQLMLDCLQVKESRPSQQQTEVTVVQRQLAHGRSILNVLEVKDALESSGAHVRIFSTAGTASHSRRENHIQQQNAETLQFAIVTKR